MTMSRQITPLNDWTFGRGTSNYVQNQMAVQQNIRTRVQCNLGECFFNTVAGVNWFGLLGQTKSLQAIQLAVSSIILNTQYVTGIIQLNVNLITGSRALSITYRVQTVFSQTGSQFIYDLAPSVS